jgi:hypothetical protein
MPLRRFALDLVAEVAAAREQHLGMLLLAAAEVAADQLSVAMAELAGPVARFGVITFF